MVPDDTVRVKLQSWVKPEEYPLLSVANPTSVHICLQNVRLPGNVTEELEIYFVVVVALRRKLQCKQRLSVSHTSRLKKKCTAGQWPSNGQAIPDSVLLFCA